MRLLGEAKQDSNVINIESGDKDKEKGIDHVFAKYRNVHELCEKSINAYLDCSSFRFVDLGSLFRSLKLL
ncbi:hypothetical protein AYI70_g1266 [Smittium culicis]|uniref:Uncharacterized protein n=1 Tax=Smittium culicis TaxID=133412 RepID=A0A1R1YDE1_9FUNG|nr:hypothetical protein AYI70_g1266 [Smittium culicis]